MPVSLSSSMQHNGRQTIAPIDPPSMGAFYWGRFLLEVLFIRSPSIGGTSIKARSLLSALSNLNLNNKSG
jgi:hypothetical protein